MGQELQQLKRDWARTAWEVTLAKWIAAAALAAFLANIGAIATFAYTTTSRLATIEARLNALEKRIEAIENRK
jgi:hypothetical protein